eukprot:gene14369-20370_t
MSAWHRAHADNTHGTHENHKNEYTLQVRELLLLRGRSSQTLLDNTNPMREFYLEFIGTPQRTMRVHMKKTDERMGAAFAIRPSRNRRHGIGKVTGPAPDLPIDLTNTLECDFRDWFDSVALGQQELSTTTHLVKMMLLHGFRSLELVRSSADMLLLLREPLSAERSESEVRAELLDTRPELEGVREALERGLQQGREECDAVLRQAREELDTAESHRALSASREDFVLGLRRERDEMERGAELRISAIEARQRAKRAEHELRIVSSGSSRDDEIRAESMRYKSLYKEACNRLDTVFNVRTELCLPAVGFEAAGVVPLQQEVNVQHVVGGGPAAGINPIIADDDHMDGVADVGSAEGAAAAAAGVFPQQLEVNNEQPFVGIIPLADDHDEVRAVEQPMDDDVVTEDTTRTAPYPPNYRETVYTSTGTVSFFAERGKQYKEHPPSKVFVEHRLPGKDGCVLIIPLAMCPDLMADPEIKKLLGLVLDIMSLRSKHHCSQKLYKGVMTSFKNSGYMQPSEGASLENNAQTVPKAKKFMEKLGMGINVYVYHLCSNHKCSHIYRNETRDLEVCPCSGCGAPRYKSGGKKLPVRKMFYLSIHDWLLDICNNPVLQEMLVWHSSERPIDKDWATDVYDGEVWKTFLSDEQMAAGNKSMAIATSLDGVSPFKRAITSAVCGRRVVPRTQNEHCPELSHY